MFDLYLCMSPTGISIKMKTNFPVNGFTDHCRVFSIQPSSCMSMTMFIRYRIFWNLCSGKSGDSTDKLKRKQLYSGLCLSRQSSLFHGLIQAFLWISCQHVDSFHLCLFNFPFIYQFYSMMNILVKPTCWNPADLFIFKSFHQHFKIFW